MRQIKKLRFKLSWRSSVGGDWGGLGPWPPSLEIRPCCRPEREVVWTRTERWAGSPQMELSDEREISPIRSAHMLTYLLKSVVKVFKYVVKYFWAKNSWNFTTQPWMGVSVCGRHWLRSWEQSRSLSCPAHSISTSTREHLVRYAACLMRYVFAFRVATYRVFH